MEKQRFWSLIKNDPLRVSILILLPDCWTLRDLIEKVYVFRMDKKSGVLASTDAERKRLPGSTAKKVVEYYDSDANSRVMSN